MSDFKNPSVKAMVVMRKAFRPLMLRYQKRLNKMI